MSDKVRINHLQIRRNNQVKALYIHVPFCQQLCGYCDYAKLLYNAKYADDFLQTLAHELETSSHYDSIYIGGGTPTSLSIDQFHSLLSLAAKHKSNHPKFEFCIEVNPENCEADKIRLMQKFGVNRVSIGVQTTQDNHLHRLNRLHSKTDVAMLINNLKQAGIVNISCDLIYGLPFQTLAEIDQDIDFLLQLPITHISLYPLTVEKNTRFFLDRINEVSDDTSAKFYHHIVKRLQNRGFRRYEVSNFSLPGFESKHNLVYWQNQNYRAVGPGACGYENGIRYCNNRNYSAYFNGVIQRSEEIIEDRDYLFEYVMLHLRTSKGILLKDFYDVFQVEFQDIFASTLSKLLESKQLIMTKKTIRISKKCIFLEHDIVSNLLKNI